MVTTLGMAWLARYYKDKNVRMRLGLKINDPKVNIEGINWYPIMQLNFRMLQLWDSRLVYDVVSHELAHLLDFRMRGWEFLTSETDHDDYWQFLHKCMRGKAERLIDVEKYKISIPNNIDISEELLETLTN
jgi:hypothetical protein